MDLEHMTLSKRRQTQKATQRDFVDVKCPEQENPQTRKWVHGYRAGRGGLTTDEDRVTSRGGGMF